MSTEASVNNFGKELNDKVYTDGEIKAGITVRGVRHVPKVPRGGMGDQVPGMAEAQADGSTVWECCSGGKNSTYVFSDRRPLV